MKPAPDSSAGLLLVPITGSVGMPDFSSEINYSVIVDGIAAARTGDAATPEPATAGLALLAGLALIARRR